MRTAINIALVVLAIFVVNACKSSDKPTDPVPTTLEPVPTTAAPTTTVAPSCPMVKPGVYICYDWGNCGGVFETYEEARQILATKDAGGCNKIDQVVIKGGFGPCSECNSVKAVTAMKMMSIAKPAMSFEEVLEQRKLKKVYIAPAK